MTPEQRSNAKQLAYGLLYGMGIARLANNLRVDKERAKQLSAEFKDNVPGIMRWKQHALEECRCAPLPAALALQGVASSRAFAVAAPPKGGAGGGQIQDAASEASGWGCCVRRAYHHRAALETPPDQSSSVMPAHARTCRSAGTGMLASALHAAGRRSMWRRLGAAGATSPTSTAPTAGTGRPQSARQSTPSARCACLAPRLPVHVSGVRVPACLSLRL